MQQRDYKDRVVVITGASSGIGEALAENLARQGARLVVAARRMDRLEAIAQRCRSVGAEAIAVTCDVTDDRQCGTLIRRAVENFGRIDVLILNAGISTNAPVQELRLEVVQKVMSVDYFGSVQPFLHALPHLIATRGQVIVISSLAGKKGLPTRAAYCGSKFALHGFFDAARLDLQQDGVGVMIACPGFVATEVRLHALKGDGREQGVDDEANQEMQTADECARDILEGAKNGKRELIMGGFGPKLMAMLQPIVPGLVDKAVLKSSSRTATKPPTP